ncbi:hypothetical protein BMS_2084 [Halobacteriovorax marinus SJ]|uniref:Bacteriophage lambda Replication protein O N-terminal domain-containing protein n=1 Tax=Halobacteriovorax marinus (strain ATCC BAA-682 / DSM 15412 / SJ) TaxID=862908 RepID=E1X365_HALMS|nr:hypothetical protein [Halobacteriovorax marinus]CBW26895.1 hypothetical protein BMS_2084 [Halobacteriovorax marinus SJ]
MVDLHSILADHRSKSADESAKLSDSHNANPTISKIPDIFFDQILTHFKLTRVEIMVLMYLYRRVWCRPNLYKEHGISQLMSHTEMAKHLGINLEDIYQSLRSLEDYNFISTIRSGQYFVRKYFTKDFDEHFGQTYDDFEI